MYILYILIYIIYKYIYIYIYIYISKVSGTLSNVIALSKLVCFRHIFESNNLGE